MARDIGTNRDIRFYTSKGRLTNYGLSCGYMEVFEQYPYRVRLWKEHGVFFISTYDEVLGKTIRYKAYLLYHSAVNQWYKQVRKVKDTNRSPAEKHSIIKEDISGTNKRNP